MSGRLHVSNIDGKNYFTQKFEHLEAFGGRGFSVWDASDLTTPVFDSAGTLEEYMEQFDKSVFNTDCVGSSYATYQSPETLRDSVSDNMVNIRPKVIKNFMLNSAEHEIKTAHLY